MLESSDIYLEFVKQLIDDERARRQSMDNRIAIMVYLSTTLVTLMVAIVAVLTSKNVHFGIAVKLLVGIAVALFILAALFGILLPLLPQRYAVPVVDANLLSKALSGESRDLTVNDVVRVWTIMIDFSRSNTSRTSRALAIAGLLQVCAILVLAIVVMLLITSSSATL